MAVNRETCRDYLATLLENELVTSLEIVQAVYGYKVGDPQGQSPIVAVLSAGTERESEVFGVDDATFYFELQVWVLYADPGASPAWTPALAEDRLDLIEKEISELIRANNLATGYWNALGYTGRSTIADVIVSGGEPYILERIPIAAEIYT